MKPEQWFIKNHPNPPRREDGSIDYEALCGEFLIEGVAYPVVKKHYDALPSELKQPE